MFPYIGNSYDYYYTYTPTDPIPTPQPGPYDLYGRNFPPPVHLNQLQPILSNNPAISTLVLFKELTGYPNYGNPSRNADILYTGTQGLWTFEVPAFFFISGLLNAQLFIRAVLDDRNTPIRQYSATIRINGRVVHRGPLPLEHGRPFGEPFVNWSTLVFNVAEIRPVNRIEIINTSTGPQDDWIGLDWMEMRFTRR